MSNGPFLRKRHRAILGVARYILGAAISGLISSMLGVLCFLGADASLGPNPRPRVHGICSRRQLTTPLERSVIRPERATAASDASILFNDQNKGQDYYWVNLGLAFQHNDGKGSDENRVA
jgi:hypothetical protein